MEIPTTAEKPTLPAETEPSRDPVSEASGHDKATRMLDFLRGYANERLNSRLMDERRCLPPSLVLDIGAVGLLGLQVEERYSGQALTHEDTCRVMVQLAAIDPNLFLVVGVHNFLGMLPIQQFATEQVRSRVLPLLASGASLATSAVSEQGIGSHLRALSTRAHKIADGGYLINGSKSWISLGGWARYVNVFAQLVDEHGHPIGITGFVADTYAAGFTIGAEALTLGMKAFPQNEIIYTDLRLPLESLLGTEGQGLTVAKTTFMAGRHVLAAGSLGAMKRSLQIARRFAAGRNVATGRLLDNGRTQQILAESVAATHAVEKLVFHIAKQLDAGRTVSPVLYLTAKILGCELMWQVVDRCVQMLGARGFLDTNIVGQFFRDYRLFRIFEGATEAVTVYLGSSILKAPQEFFALLDTQFDASSPVRELSAAVADLAAEATVSEAHRHILANTIGDIACWTVIAELTSAVARRSDAIVDTHTAHWCEHKLRERIRTAHIELDTSHQPPAVDILNDHIIGYESMIGDIEQTLPGEHRELDKLLYTQPR